MAVGGVLAAEREAQQHRRRQDRADRVGDVLAGDVGRGAVDRLVQPERAVRRPALPERRRRQHAEAPGQDRGLVGQDVAEQVLGDDDIEVGRPPDEEHRARVDELVAERHVRVARRRSRSATVRHRRDVARTLALSTEVTVPRRVARQLERQPTIRRDLGSVYGSVSSARRSPRVTGRLPALAEVDAAGQLADDEQVHALEQLRAERRRGDERRVDA